MSAAGQVAVILGLSLAFVAPLAAIVIRHNRMKRRVAAAGPDAIRARLDAVRQGHPGELPPVVEELLDRIELLEAEVDELQEAAAEQQVAATGGSWKVGEVKPGPATMTWLEDEGPQTETDREA